MWCCLISVAVAANLATGPDVANDQVFDGKVTTVTEGKLSVSDSAGQMMQTFAVPSGAKVTLNGKSAGLMELMRGDAVTITMDGKQIKSIAAVRNIKV